MMTSHGKEVHGSVHTWPATPFNPIKLLLFTSSDQGCVGQRAGGASPSIRPKPSLPALAPPVPVPSADRLRPQVRPQLPVAPTSSCTPKRSRPSLTEESALYLRSAGAIPSVAALILAVGSPFPHVARFYRTSLNAWGGKSD